MEDLKIKPEFRDLIPKLTDEENAQLEANILEAGEVKEPIIVWNGYIVDGHHRWYIIEKHPEIPYEIEEMDFENEHAAMAWACRNQLGRRNLSDGDWDYLIGKRFEEEKAAHGGTGANQYTKEQRCQSDTSANVSNDVATKIAEEHGIGRRTVFRDEEYAKGVDIADEIVPGLKDEITHGNIQVTKKIMQKLPKADAETQRKAVGLIAEGEIHKAEIVIDGDADIIDGMYDTGEESPFTEFDLLQEMTFSFKRYMDSMDTMLEEHSDILEDDDVRERVYDAYINLLKDKLFDLEEEKR